MYDTSAKLQKTANTRLAFCTCQNMVLLKSITGGCRSGEYYQRLRPLCYKKCGNLHVSFKDVMRLRIIRAAQQHRKNRLKRWIGLGMKALEYHHVETTWIKVNKLEQNETWLRCVCNLKAKLSKKIAARLQMQKLASSQWERCKSLHEARCRKSCTLCNKERRKSRRRGRADGECRACRQRDRPFNSGYGGECTCYSTIVTYHCDSCGDDYEENTMKWSAPPYFAPYYSKPSNSSSDSDDDRPMGLSLHCAASL